MHLGRIAGPLVRIRGPRRCLLYPDRVGGREHRWEGAARMRARPLPVKPTSCSCRNVETIGEQLPRPSARRTDLACPGQRPLPFPTGCLDPTLSAAGPTHSHTHTHTLSHTLSHKLSQTLALSHTLTHALTNPYGRPPLRLHHLRQGLLRVKRQCARAPTRNPRSVPPCSVSPIDETEKKAEPARAILATQLTCVCRVPRTSTRG